MIKNTWAVGFKPEFQALSDPRQSLLIQAEIDHSDGMQALGLDEEFLIKILNKRIEVMKLPISFGPAGKLAALAHVDRAGAMVVLLIDCLNAFEGKEVTPGMLIDLYGGSFYTEASFIDYIDNFMKPKKVKWAEVY